MKNVRIILVLVILLFPATVWATMDGSLAASAETMPGSARKWDPRLLARSLPGSLKPSKKGSMIRSGSRASAFMKNLILSSIIKRFVNTSASSRQRVFSPFIGKEGLIRRLSWARRWLGSKTDTGEKNGRADGSSFAKAGQEPLPSIRHCFRRGWIRRH